jgi:hypothetical protein
MANFVRRLTLRGDNLMTITMLLQKPSKRLNVKIKRNEQSLLTMGHDLDYAAV